jgi:hypothetical protein
VREEAIRRGLNRSQIRALQKLKEASSEEYQRVAGNGHMASNSVGEAKNKDISQIDLNDLSCREIKVLDRINRIELFFNSQSQFPPIAQKTLVCAMFCLLSYYQRSPAGRPAPS